MAPVSQALVFFHFPLGLANILSAAEDYPAAANLLTAFHGPTCGRAEVEVFIALMGSIKGTLSSGWFQRTRVLLLLLALNMFLLPDKSTEQSSGSAQPDLYRLICCYGNTLSHLPR